MLMSQQIEVMIQLSQLYGHGVEFLVHHLAHSGHQLVHASFHDLSDRRFETDFTLGHGVSDEVMWLMT